MLTPNVGFISLALYSLGSVSVLHVHNILAYKMIGIGNQKFVNYVKYSYIWNIEQN